MIPKKLNQVTLKRTSDGITGRMGLSWVAHSLKHYGVEEIIDKHFPIKQDSHRAIATSRKVMEGALTLIAGGERIEDIEVLRADEGLCKSLGGNKIISPDTLRELLKIKRSGGRMRKSNEEMVIRVMKEAKEKEFTYDNDATYFDSEKKSANYSYQKRKQFSGLLGFIAELGICATVDFRRGHISPRTGIYNQLRKVIQMAENAGKRIAVVRMDSAGHQNKIFEKCNEKSIRYYISLAKNEEVKESIYLLKEKMWTKLPEPESEKCDVEWAETIYAPNEGAAMRMLVLRWPNPDPNLFERSPYCYHAIGTNDNEIEPREWLKVHNGRMNSENYNKELKTGLSGDYTPSHDYSLNRNYFLLNIFAYNLAQIMKLFYLGANARKWTLKTLRYRFIYVCGKIIKSGRRYICKIMNVCDETFSMFESCLSRLVLAT
jgi:hypothetical protein